jgi:hypothetical protein
LIYFILITPRAFKSKITPGIIGMNKASTHTINSNPFGLTINKYNKAPMNQVKIVTIININLVLSVFKLFFDFSFDIISPKSLINLIN